MFMELLQVLSDRPSNKSVEGHLYCLVVTFKLPLSSSPICVTFTSHITPTSVEGFTET